MINMWEKCFFRLIALVTLGRVYAQIVCKLQGRVAGKRVSTRDKEAVEHGEHALPMQALPEDASAEIAVGEPLVAVENGRRYALLHP